MCLLQFRIAGEHVVHAEHERAGNGKVTQSLALTYLVSPDDLFSHYGIREEELSSIDPVGSNVVVCNERRFGRARDRREMTASHSTLKMPEPGTPK